MGRGRWLLAALLAGLCAAAAALFLRAPGPRYEPVSEPPRAPAARADAAPRPSRPDAGPGDLVDVRLVDPTIVVELRYARPDNFLGRAVYPVGARPLLRREVAERLARVQTRLRADGLRLKLWDAYRPLAVQREMWKLVPDPRYVADPAVGGKHNRGAAVDVTLVDPEGNELPMPTAHDDFSPAAAQDAPAAEPARSNRERLRKAMEAEGFVVMPTEWWHFDAPGWERYPAVDEPL